MQLVARTDFCPEAGAGVKVAGNSYCTRASGVDRIRTGSTGTQSDKAGTQQRSFSSDNGRTWTGPEPWRAEDRKLFFSPSGCSQLLPHSSGRLFWLGNVCSESPKGSQPRYALVLGEVDTGDRVLRRDTMLVVDDRRPPEHVRLALPNFMAHEDRETGEILLHISRAFQHGDRTSAAYLSSIQV